MKTRKYMKTGIKVLIGVILFLITAYMMICGCGSFSPVGSPQKSSDDNGMILPSKDAGRTIISTQVSQSEISSPSPYFFPFGLRTKPVFTAYTFVVEGSKEIKSLGGGIWEVQIGDTLRIGARFDGGTPIYKGLVVNNVVSNTAALDDSGKFHLLVSRDSSGARISFLNMHSEYLLYDAVFLTPADSASQALLIYNDGLSFSATSELRKLTQKGKDWFGVIRSIPELGSPHKVRVVTKESGVEKNNAKLYVSVISPSGLGDLVDLKLGDPTTSERGFAISSGAPVFSSQGSSIVDRSAQATETRANVPIQVDTLVTPDPYSIRTTGESQGELKLSFSDSLVKFVFAGQSLSLPAGSFISQDDSLFYWVVTRLTFLKWESGMGFWPLSNGVLRTGTTFITYGSSIAQGDLQGAGTYALIRFRRENLYSGANPVTTISYGTSDSSKENYPMIVVVNGVMPYGWKFNEQGNVVLNPPSAYKL